MRDVLFNIIDTEELRYIEADMKPLGLKGLYFDDYICVCKSIETTAEKTCVLAEELGHFFTTCGDILDQTSLHNQKQEETARRWAANALIDPHRLIDAFKVGVRNRWELAQFLELTEEFIEDSLICLKKLHGDRLVINEYVIHFDPLWIYKSF
jgi:Zn-dependent peptidase ImmA (M78 family)